MDMDQFPVSAFLGGTALGIGFSLFVFSLVFAYWQLVRKPHQERKNKKKEGTEAHPLFLKVSDPEIGMIDSNTIAPSASMPSSQSFVQLERSLVGPATLMEAKAELDSERKKVGELTKKAGIHLLEVETLRDQIANLELLVEQLQMELEGNQTISDKLSEENQLLQADLQSAEMDIERLLPNLDPIVQSNFRFQRNSGECTSIESIDAKFKKRTRVVQEILETEKTYVKSLHVIREEFLQPLEDLISAEDHKAIFHGIKEIIPIHDTLIAELKRRVANWTKEQCIGDIFMTMISKLKLYTRYSNNYDKSLATVAKLMKTNSEFSQFIQRNSRKSNGYDLSSYLIQPIQRIPRYVLLLDEVVKVTPSSHKDYQDLFIAFNKIKEVATFINDQKRMTETLEKMVEVQSKLAIKETDEPGLLKYGRFFLMEGSLLHINIRGVRQTYNFLFSDLFIVAKKSRLIQAESFRGSFTGTRKFYKHASKFKGPSLLLNNRNYKEIMRINLTPHVIIIKNPNLSDYKKEFHMSDAVANIKHSFGIVSGDDVILFGCGDSIIKDRWLHMLGEAIETLKLKNSQSDIAKVRESHIEAAKMRISEVEISKSQSDSSVPKIGSDLTVPLLQSESSLSTISSEPEIEKIQSEILLPEKNIPKIEITSEEENISGEEEDSQTSLGARESIIMGHEPTYPPSNTTSFI